MIKDIVIKGEVVGYVSVENSLFPDITGDIIVDIHMVGDDDDDEHYDELTPSLF